MLNWKTFFNLDAFEHKDLFSEKGFVWEALDNIESYLSLLVLGTIEVEICHFVTLVNPDQIAIDEGVVIESGVQIEGPCLIGKNSKICHGASIRAYSIIGDGCVVGHASEIKGSILLDGAKAPHFNYVGDSILGSNVNLGAGVICANVRLDEKPIEIRIGQQKIPTNRIKLGAILADQVQIGCQCVINPGTLLGPGYSSKALESIHGVFLPKEPSFHEQFTLPE
ncbi:MAG: UDP-N-acetylglucosamine diphosphorylase [Simkaniaceae bacterium]